MKKITGIVLLYMIMLAAHNAHGQTSAADNKIAESITFKDPPSGPVYGVFEGRSSCAGIIQQFNYTPAAECDHLKWQVIFYHDPVTHQPTTFSLSQGLADKKPLTGKWKISKGRKTDPSAIIFELDYGNPGKPFCLLKGDDNVLFILDENREPRSGNKDYSFTLNRVIKVHRDTYP